ncbi:MAG: hypothetical protein ABF572_04875 [Gluconobacter sp.]|uniref:hypothetical protein n=1 Tax=Gluconobacter sp. TaxID=1876758 RepID=UPI0039EA1D2D
MSSSNRYILYRTAASGNEAVGCVVNVFVWGGTGTELPIPPDTAIAADPAGKYPIGSTYVAPAL